MPDAGDRPRSSHHASDQASHKASHHGPPADQSSVGGRFIAALSELEQGGDPGLLVDLYADDATAGNVQRRDPFRGRAGIREFWSNYRAAFGDVASRFTTVVEGSDAVALEWETKGTVGDTAIRYCGVTVLELSGERIRRSFAYFDPTVPGRQLQEPTSADAPPGRKGQPGAPEPQISS